MHDEGGGGGRNVGGQRAINPSYWPTALWEVEGRKGGGMKGGSEVIEYISAINQ